MPFDRSVFKHAKNKVKVIPNQIVNQHDVLPFPFDWKYHKSINLFGNFNKGIQVVVNVIF